MSSPPTLEANDDTLAMAKDALVMLRGMVELLDGCPYDYPLSAGLFVGLLRPMAQNMDQIVGDLRTECSNRAAAMQAGMQLSVH